MIEVKLCECGCGRPTAIAESSCKSRGMVKGYGMRFIKGHAREGMHHTEEAKQKLSIAGCRRVVSEETKEKIRSSTLGKVRSKETREKMGKAKVGELNPKWKGKSIIWKLSGNQRAVRMYTSIGECQECGERPALDRHHKDGDTTNNEPENVLFLCRSCHMKADGRMKNLNQFQEVPVVLGHDGRGRFCTMMV
jgi:hypothetical protein